jgi:hypothetical protein
MNDEQRTLRQQMQAEADQLEIEVEGYRYQHRDIIAAGAAFRRLALEIALAFHIPEFIEWSNRTAKRVRR